MCRLLTTRARQGVPERDGAAIPSVKRRDPACRTAARRGRDHHLIKRHVNRPPDCTATLPTRMLHTLFDFLVQFEI